MDSILKSDPHPSPTARISLPHCYGCHKAIDSVNYVVDLHLKRFMCLECLDDMSQPVGQWRDNND